MVKYWLMKSEPNKFSWDDLCAVPQEPWDGVRNYQASNNMKAMQLGDLAFFYHSVKEKQIVGICEVAKLYYPDHTDTSGRFGMVDVKAVKPFKMPVTLAKIKATPSLENMQLIKQARLSVCPVEKDEWDIISKMGGI